MQAQKHTSKGLSPFSYSKIHWPFSIRIVKQSYTTALIFSSSRKLIYSARCSSKLNAQTNFLFYGDYLTWRSPPPHSFITTETGQLNLQFLVIINRFAIGKNFNRKQHGPICGKTEFWYHKMAENTTLMQRNIINCIKSKQNF